MARSIEDLVLVMETKAAEFPELDEIENNPSRTAEWDASKKVIAFVIQGMEEIIDQHKIEVSGLIVDQETGRIQWYRDRIKEYQHGDVLATVNNQITYNIIDPAKQIITHAGIKEDGVDGSLIIRAAKGSPPEPLDAEELAGLGIFLKSVKFAGTKIDLASPSPDPVRYTIDIEVDQSILNLSGERIDGTSNTPVLDAINAFHQNIGEDGVVYLSKVIDSIQAIPGVIDPHMVSADYWDGDSWEVIDKKFESTATYVVLDEVETNFNYS